MATQLPNERLSNNWQSSLGNQKLTNHVNGSIRESVKESPTKLRKKKKKTLIVHFYQRINLAEKKGNPLITCIERSLNWFDTLKMQVYSDFSIIMDFFNPWTTVFLSASYLEIVQVNFNSQVDDPSKTVIFPLHGISYED